AEELENLNLPYEKEIELERGRYKIQFVSDKPIWMFLCSEFYYNDWKNTGNQPISMASTGCCREKQKKSDFLDTFDIAKTGKYYAIFQGAKITNIKYKITQIFKI
ncbi:MAG: hypothetical protein ACTSWZ_07400, partial [Candidatus Heimdallarchaeaceae archaeon]